MTFYLNCFLAVGIFSVIRKYKRDPIDFSDGDEKNVRQELGKEFFGQT